MLTYVAVALLFLGALFSLLVGVYQTVKYQRGRRRKYRYFWVPYLVSALLVVFATVVIVMSFPSKAVGADLDEDAELGIPLTEEEMFQLYRGSPKEFKQLFYTKIGSEQYNRLPATRQHMVQKFQKNVQEYMNCLDITKKNNPEFSHKQIQKECEKYRKAIVP